MFLKDAGIVKPSTSSLPPPAALLPNQINLRYFAQQSHVQLIVRASIMGNAKRASSRK
jgi:hypothetical protein